MLSKIVDQVSYERMAGPVPSSDPGLYGLLSEHFPTFTDEYGSFYCFIEGQHGGKTVLLWTNPKDLHDVLSQLPAIRGRWVVGADVSGGHQAPFDRALYWAEPAQAVIVGAEGITRGFSGAKETAAGWADLGDPAPALTLEVVTPTGLRYLEHRSYPAWGEPTASGIHISGWAQGVSTYGVGLVGLSQNLLREMAS
jgi:hypothetical protein